MMETENELWTQLFQDKPIPQAALESFQAQIMAQIVAHPVNFGVKVLAERRKWGLGLAISLLAIGFAFGAFLWFEGNLLYPGLQVLLVILAGLPFTSEFQYIGHQILQGMLLFRELKTGLILLWGVVSWPILGVLSVMVIFRRFNPVHDGKHST
ncbi:hypothetical protein [Desulfosporosinus sp. BG]|uniref:hypothetical protein n=1 Tax=Desulfosporosinus sp. BG TaxID=1633135 RepID=UPI00083AC639|nr:hypothetical protein [Desulfosporosinus sp. BG]